MNKAQSYLYVSSIIVCGGGWSKFVRMSFSIQCLEREVFLSLEALATQEQSWYTMFFFFLPKIATHIYHNLFVCRGHLLVSLLFYWQLSHPHRIQASHHHQTRNLLCLNHFYPTFVSTLSKIIAEIHYRLSNSNCFDSWHGYPRL